MTISNIVFSDLLKAFIALFFAMFASAYGYLPFDMLPALIVLNAVTALGLVTICPLVNQESI